MLKKTIYAKLLVVLSFLITVFSIANLVFGATDPVSPQSITQISTSGFDTTDYPAQNTTAIAGNVTELSITALAPTQSWQGYFGNITGTITLQDASGNIFYNWTVAEPKGEIYASLNSSINWSAIKCFNFTANTSLEINLTTMESTYNIQTADVDGIDETFNETSNPTIYVGQYTVAASSCPTTYVYQNTGKQYTNFINTLLTDKEKLVYTTVIENDQTNNNTDVTGYNGQSYDFQMLVAEDGHNADTSTTIYYFWVEIT
ncbi:hypothetical protein C4573_04925 [Candidatus Woesearchaeota archaeon]|nr:MAG: hypothetical protein C4573_04925 [Candidatus Woesearchaeota archaeon]